MSYALATYSDKYEVKDVTVSIVKVQNGYIFELSGDKKIRTKKDWHYESFSAKFVYDNLDKGLSEVSAFFKIIEKELKKK